MNKINTSLLFFVIVINAVSCQSENNEKRPNVIFIMVDDLGYADLSSYGNDEFSTPNIDLFINQGLKFTNAYAAAPFCSPTRVALMTGKYPAKFAIGLREPITLSESDQELGLSPTIPTLTSILKQNNYETALFGKWHLGQKEMYLPSKHGVDQFFGIMCGAADHIDHKPFDRQGDLLFKMDLPNLFENNNPISKKGYLNDLITEYSLDFISKEHKTPFFLSIQFTAPHWPWQGPTDLPVDKINYSTSGSKEIYETMLQNLDDNFGKIMRALIQANLDKSTLVIFTNDNGGAKFANQGHLKGNKGSLYEGGIRVPAAVRWPSVTIPKSTTEQAVITMDWTKTILSAIRSHVAEDEDLDGIDLKKYFQNPNLTDERMFFWKITNRKQEIAVRKGAYKYLKNDSGEFLFNLESDVMESKNLIDMYPEITSQLKQEVKKYNTAVLNPEDAN